MEETHLPAPLSPVSDSLEERVAGSGFADLAGSPGPSIFSLRPIRRSKQSRRSEFLGSFALLFKQQRIIARSSPLTRLLPQTVKY